MEDNINTPYEVLNPNDLQVGQGHTSTGANFILDTTNATNANHILGAHSDLYYDADGDDPGQAQLVAHLIGVTTLDASMFHFV
jgi:hypothetical protein